MEFQWHKPTSIPTYPHETLIHEPSSYFYRFMIVPGSTSGHFGVFSPGAAIVEGKVDATTWDRQRQHVDSWLSRLKQEYDAPDFWTAALEEPSLGEVVSTTSESNALLSVEEQSSVTVQLRQIEQHLLTMQSYTQEQSEYIREQFDYLEQGATRLGRKDYKNMVVGALFSMALSLTLTPQNAQQLFRYAAAMLQYIANQLPLLP